MFMSSTKKKEIKKKSIFNLYKLSFQNLIKLKLRTINFKNDDFEKIRKKDYEMKEVR